MAGVSVRDIDRSTGTLSVDLRDILRALDNRVARSRWRVANLECLGGPAADILHKASEDGRQLEGDELIELAKKVGQIVDGEFSAWLPGESAPWVVIRAVDSSAFDILTDERELIGCLKCSFSDVIDMPE